MYELCYRSVPFQPAPALALTSASGVELDLHFCAVMQKRQITEGTSIFHKLPSLKISNVTGICND